MNLIKISNFQSEGVSDFKGLDLGLIVGGSQFFDVISNEYYCKYKGTVSESIDVAIITLEEYTSKEYDIQSGLPMSIENQIKAMNEKQALMQKAIDDLILGGAI